MNIIFLGGKLSLTNARPVLVRELRAESRRPVSHWLRVLAAAVVVAVFVMFMAGTQLSATRSGAALFDLLERALLLAVWIIVPLMTADCISREKREGTLGLLFLTPLSVLDVIIGKAATQVLRATTLFLASVPVLVLPFVLGGVVWEQALVAVALTANALLLGLAAGLYASAKGGTEIQVMVMAEGCALLLAVAFGIAESILGLMASPSLVGLAWRLATIAVLTGLMFARVIDSSVRKLRETWDQDPAETEQPRWVALFSGSEFWRTAFHWERGRALDQNPVAWLQEYSWTARLTKWGWCAAILLAELFMLIGLPGARILGTQEQLTVVLALGVAFSAAGSFRRERQTGLLEVLLVTPLSVRQLVAGRLWGIGGHFFPALAVLAVCWNSDRMINVRHFHHNPLAWVFPNPLAFLALMVVGLYLSLWRLNFLMSWLLTATVAFIIPAMATVMLARFAGAQPAVIVALTSGFQLALTAACWFLLVRDLEQRRFLRATTN